MISAWVSRMRWAEMGQTAKQTLQGHYDTNQKQHRPTQFEPHWAGNKSQNTTRLEPGWKTSAKFMVCQRHDVHCNCRYPTKGQNHAESWTTHTSCTKSLSADPWHSDHSRQTCIELTKWPAGSVNADPNSNGDNCIQQCATGHIAPFVEEHKAKASTCCCFQSRAKLHTHAVCALDCFSLDVLGQIQTGIDDLIWWWWYSNSSTSPPEHSQATVCCSTLDCSKPTKHSMAWRGSTPFLSIRRLNCKATTWTCVIHSWLDAAYCHLLWLIVACEGLLT